MRGQVAAVRDGHALRRLHLHEFEDEVDARRPCSAFFERMKLHNIAKYNIAYYKTLDHKIT